MSSTYHILCVSHDPAIIIDGEQDYTQSGFAEALRAASTPADHEHLAQHANCDLLVGRYSYPLIEVACPGVRPHCPGYHRCDSETRTDAGWLRLLRAAYKRDDDVGSYGLPTCWTRDRVLRLGREIGP